MTAYGGVKLEGEDYWGLPYAFASDGTLYYPTPCCGASAKGSEDGIVCRRCYNDIDDGLGGVPEIPAEAGDVAFYHAPGDYIGRIGTVETINADGSIVFEFRDGGERIMTNARRAVRPYIRPSRSTEGN